MSYESSETYLKVFDHTQSPLYLNWLAARFGVPSSGAAARSQSAGSTTLVYLDLGCGAGKTILALAPLYPRLQFIGVDFNPTHIAEAQAEAARQGLANAQFLCADFRNLPPLPEADHVVVRGIYSWLSPEVKGTLESALKYVAKAGALIKLHYSVRPGAMFRETLGQLLQGMPEGRTPKEGREFLDLLVRESSGLQKHFANVTDIIASLNAGSDELWWHDYLNEDFKAECAHEVMERLQENGLSYVAATRMERNNPRLLVSAPVLELAGKLSTSRAQTLYDHATGNSMRDDLFVREQVSHSAATFDGNWRYGLVQPEASQLLACQTDSGQIRYQNTDCQQVVKALRRKPLGHADLLGAVPQIPAATVNFWLDLLIAGGKAAPFLSHEDAMLSDKACLRRINHDRLAHSMLRFGPSTTTPLLAAEYGNCLLAGWFETLILANFARRHVPAVQRTMLARIHGARMAFPGADGKPAEDQLSAFRLQLEKLESNYLTLMPYWGIEVAP